MSVWSYWLWLNEREIAWKRGEDEKEEVGLRIKNERTVGIEKEGKMIFYLSTYKKQENALQIFW